MCWRLQPYVLEAATVVLEAATICADCNHLPMLPGYLVTTPPGAAAGGSCAHRPDAWYVPRGLALTQPLALTLTLAPALAPTLALTLTLVPTLAPTLTSP